MGLGNKSVDVAAIYPDRKIAYEVVQDPNLDKEVSNFKKDTQCGYDQVIFCVDNDDIGRALALRLERECSGDKRYEIRHLTEFAS